MVPLFWKGRRVFLTGHTGFKGGWLAAWLHQLGAEVSGFSLAPDTRPSFFERCRLDDRIRSTFGDVRDAAAVERALESAQPELVVHMAAQPLVRRSLREPAETLATNVMGTVHLLNAVRRAPSVRAVLVVTSDKCYAERADDRGCREDDPLGGNDPYSASKAAQELVAQAWRRAFFEKVALATARAGNVIGGGDWAEDRLVPDAVRAFDRGNPLLVRNPDSVRPWQHVLDPLYGYLSLAERLLAGDRTACRAWNFGPEDTHTVARLADLLAEAWGGRWEAARETASKEAGVLRLDASDARRLLNWSSRLDLATAVAWTARWYREALRPDADMFALTRDQIRAYMALP